MKQQEVFKKIGNIINELNEQYEYFSKADEPLNDLELELFVANAHFLADHSEVLKKINAQNTPAPAAKTEKTAEKKEEKYFEPVIQQAEPQPESKGPAKEALEDETPVPHIDLAANGADDDFSYVREEPEIIKHELVLDESELWDDEDDRGFEIEELPEISADKPKKSLQDTHPLPVKREAPVEVKKETPPAKAKHEEPPVEVKKEAPPAKVEKEGGEPLTINQKMSAQLHHKSVATEHIQPVSDLKQAITLNDKLLYIKDLFNGYNLAYSEAIDILNRFSTFDEAENFLNSNYAAKNHWESKQATADKFYALLRRRYA
jgi:hypothetical protein